MHTQLDRLLPPLMSCLLHSDFAARGESPVDSDEDEEGLSQKWTHWEVRDHAARLLSSVCERCRQALV